MLLKFLGFLFLIYVIYGVWKWIDSMRAHWAGVHRREREAEECLRQARSSRASEEREDVEDARYVDI